MERHWKAHESGIKNVTFSPDGQLLASTSPDRLIKLWTITGQFIMNLSGHQEGVNDVSFSPDGQLLASASADKTIKLWKLDGTLLNTLQGHEDWINTVLQRRNSCCTACFDKWYVELVEALSTSLRCASLERA